MRRVIAAGRRAFRSYHATPSGKANRVILVFALIVTIFLLWLFIRGGWSSSPTLNVLLAVAATCLAGSFFNLVIQVLQEMSQDDAREQFVDFFGREAAESQYQVFFSTLKPHGKLVSENPRAKEENAYPKGVEHVISYEEVAGIAELDSIFRNFGGSLDICLDTHIRKRADDFPDVSCLSIGLGFSIVTAALSEYSGNSFRIGYGNPLACDLDESLQQDDITDELIIDGEKIEPEGLSDFALIARILHDKRPYLVCAGRSAKGTAAALKYLARHWPVLFDEYKAKNKGLMSHHLVVKISHHRLGLEPDDKKPEVKLVSINRRKKPAVTTAT